MFGDALGGRVQVELKHTDGGRERPSLEMRLQAMIEQESGSTRRWSIQGAPDAIR